MAEIHLESSVVLNQHAEKVLCFVATLLFKRRSTAAGADPR